MADVLQYFVRFLESKDKASLRNYHHVLREKIKVVKTLTPEELLGLTDIEGSALNRNLGAEVYVFMTM